MERFAELPEMNMDTTETGCYPQFVPMPWNEKIFELSHLKMVKVSTHSFFYMPLNMNQVMTRTQKAIIAASADCKDKYFVLSNDRSKWRCDHYFLVEREVPGLENIGFSGTFQTLVYEGNYGKITQGIKALKTSIEENGNTLKKIYVFYTTCPSCAEHYGKNYMVLFGEI